MRLLEASGSPSQIGEQIGASARDLVAAAVELICRFDAAPRADLAERLAAVERRLAETFPDVLDEAAGLARGALIDPRDALALSVCSDLTGRLPAYCSVLAVDGDSGPLVGKNLDTAREMAPLQVLERIEPEDGHGYLHITTAGAMWTDGGVNDAGLAVANASLASAVAERDGVPDGILVRELLVRCADVESAVAFAESFEFRTLGENVLVADSKGRAAVIEKLPGRQAVRRGIPIRACNHVLSPELEEGMDPADPVRENSRRRFDLLGSSSRVVTPWTAAAVHALLSDPSNGLAQSGAESLWTVATLVVDPTSRQVWASSADGELETHGLANAAAADLDNEKDGHAEVG